MMSSAALEDRSSAVSECFVVNILSLRLTAIFQVNLG